MNELDALVKIINRDYAASISALTPFVLGIMSFLYYRVYVQSKLKEGDAALLVKPTFFSFGKKYKVLAVHKFKISDDVSGYKHLGQNSRPDQWQQLIKIKSSFLNCWHKVEPLNKDEILTVVISRNGKEKWHTMHFNK